MKKHLCLLLAIVALFLNACGPVYVVHQDPPPQAPPPAEPEPEDGFLTVNPKVISK